MKKKYLIVNADDFGLDEKVNEGIIEAYQRGIVTSTSILANGSAFEHGVRLLKDNPGLGVGVHLALVAGRPLGKWQTIVVGGEFYPDYHSFFRRYLTGRISLQEIKEEWRLQIKKVQQSGLRLTHLDSHQHLHLVPGILKIVLELADEFAISCLRCPRETQLAAGIPSVFRLIARSGLSLLSSYAQPFIKQKCITTDDFLGMLWGGSMSEEKLKTVLSNMTLKGTTELMVHPGVDDRYLKEKTGWDYHWEEEKNALVSAEIIRLLKKLQVSLINYGDLPDAD